MRGKCDFCGRWSNIEKKRYLEGYYYVCEECWPRPEKYGYHVGEFRDDSQPLRRSQ